MILYDEIYRLKTLRLKDKLPIAIEQNYCKYPKIRPLNGHMML